MYVRHSDVGLKRIQPCRNHAEMSAVSHEVSLLDAKTKKMAGQAAEFFNPGGNRRGSARKSHT